ncbi:t-SNARE [Phycomyces nitens]|nr:t-SNARE [Phycomyces nitens]
MNVDRLAELSRPGQNASNTSQNRSQYEMRPLLSSASNGAMDDNMAEITHIEESIQTIRVNVQRIQTHQTAMLGTADASEIQRNRLAIDELTAETQSVMAHVKQKLKEMQPTSRHKDLEIRKVHFSRLTRQFMDAIEAHRSAAVAFQKDETRQLERQIKIANPNATPESIDKAIAQAEEGRPAIFAQQLMQSMNNEQRRYNAQDTLDAVQERHADIGRLVKSVQELSNLFSEMQYMLENQAQVLDHVEEMSEQVVQDIEKGTRHVDAAISSAKATRRKKWICFAIFMIIVIILVVVLCVKLIPSNNNNNNDSTPTQ